MSNIVFVGGQFRNKGSEAMIISTAATLKRFLPSTKFTIMSHYHEDANKDLGGEFKVIWDHTRNVRSRSLLRNVQSLLRNVRSRLLLLFMSLLYSIVPLNAFRQFLTRKSTVLREFCNADAVVDMSGFALTDDMGLKRMLYYCSGIILCKLLGTPFIVYPQSMGPFNSISSRILVRLFLPMADLIMVRGESTKKNLEKIGINTKRIHACADSAFLFEAVPSEKAAEILNAHGTVDKTLVGIAPNIRIYERCDGIGSANTYEVLLTKIIDYIIDEFDAKVVLIPFEYKIDGYDDRLIINEILMNIKKQNSVFAIDKEYSAAELKAIIGQLDLLLASRFHSVVASASMRVPVVVIGWAHKYVELMKELGLEEYVIDYRKAFVDEIKCVLKKMWHNKEEIVKKLEIEVIKTEKSALEAGELVKNLLSSS